MNLSYILIYDKSDRKRIYRTCNNIGLKNKNAGEWDEFPQNGIAIGADRFGNKLILTVIYFTKYSYM